MKNVLIILTPGFPANEADTTCVPFVQSVVKNIHQYYPHITLVVLAFDYPYTRTAYEWKGIQVIPMGFHNSRGIKRYFQLKKVYRQLKQIKQEHVVTGLLSFWCSDTALTGQLFARMNRLPHYCWLQGQDARKGNRAMRLLQSDPSVLIAISASMQQDIKKNYGIEITRVLPNAIDPSDFEHIPSAERNIDILGVGSLIPLKQWDIFLVVISRLVKHFPELRCTLCGDGPEKERLQQLVKEYGLNEHIQFTGQLPHYQALQLMKTARILLHPSSYEGYSKVLAEALYAGCYCVSFVHHEKAAIPHWYVVSNVDEMINRCIEILQDKATSHEPVLIHHIADCIHQLMGYYNLRNTDNISSAIAVNDKAD